RPRRHSQANPRGRVGSRAYRRHAISARLYRAAQTKGRRPSRRSGHHSDGAGDWLSNRGRPLNSFCHESLQHVPSLGESTGYLTQRGDDLSRTDGIDPISALWRPERLTAVVDIGANPIDGDPPYKGMLTNRLCTLVGFEPQEEALAKLNAAKSDLETYL